jgi:hypothetical protein
MRSTPGWQLLPVFHVYQHETYREVLEELVVFFGCGQVRKKGGTSKVLTYAMSGLKNLDSYVVPFF